MNDLAIVIPAYKKEFFDKTLNSLARQTNKCFTVYIGDDCSPYDLLSIVNTYKKHLTIHYERFPENIGPKNLVLQWARCMALTKQEKWLCLFSDDDLLDDNCIENFYRTLEEKENAFDVFRFNTLTINENDEIINPGIIGPEIEGSVEMAYNLLKGERGNSMPDHIFSRKIYEACGGFVFTEYAQGADWATSILFSKDTGICVIQNANMYWRYSGINISSIASANKNSMINGHLQFISWALKHFEYLKTASLNISYEMMKEVLRTNLKTVLIYHYKGFDLKQTLPLLIFQNKNFKLSYYDSLKELIEIKFSNVPLVINLKHLNFRIKHKLYRIKHKLNLIRAEND